MLERAFVEFKPYLGGCKYYNCRHLAEPQCAILDAVADGKIAQDAPRAVCAAAARIGADPVLMTDVCGQTPNIISLENTSSLIIQQITDSQNMAGTTPPTIKHFLQFSDFTRDEFEYLIERAAVIKRKFKNYEIYHPLVDRTLVMVFEKNSTRTRLSFEAGMHQLGGAAIYLNTRDSQLGRGEPVEDAGQVMSPHVRHHHGAHLRPGHHRALRRQFARAGDQRPDQRTPPLPGAGRHLHLSRAPRLASPARPWPGSATPTTCCTPGCRRPRCSAST